MIIDKTYCMSSFLQFRFVEKEGYAFNKDIIPRRYCPLRKDRRRAVRTAEELLDSLRMSVKDFDFSKTAIMLSGGIDSAILAKLVPKRTKAYTLKCIAPNAVDETEQAKRYAAENDLDIKVVDVTWEDYLKYAPMLVKHMGQPIHSIEPQIYKAALCAKADGIDNLIFGETADIIYGGLDGLLSRDWILEEFIERHNFVNPEKVLKDGIIITEPYERHTYNGVVDVYEFLNDVHLRQSPASYLNSCSLAGMNFIAPYADTVLGEKLDIGRVRSGDNKYIVREAFAKLYPSFGQPEKVPMPRALSIWMQDYKGPDGDEFKPNCIDGGGNTRSEVVCVYFRYVSQGS